MNENELSPEAAAYLHDLRTLPFEEFRQKHSTNVHTARAEERRRERKASRAPETIGKLIDAGRESK